MVIVHPWTNMLKSHVLQLHVLYNEVIGVMATNHAMVEHAMLHRFAGVVLGVQVLTDHMYV